MNQAELRRCQARGELKGAVVVEDRCDTSVRIPVICICQGIPCPQCGKRLIRRPISNRYDEATRDVWHTPWFGYLIRCANCRAN